MSKANATAIYIDGYNLYYGRLRGTPFKWLDVVTFFDRLLRIQDPSTDLRLVRYFSAPALQNFSTHGERSVIAQQAYHRALQFLHQTRFKITLGAHSYNKNGALLPEFFEGEPYDRGKRVRVWKLEEKKTDVNLALAMYRDALSGDFDTLVVCSADSDVEPVLEAIKSDYPEIRIGVIMPRRPSAPGAKSGGRGMISSLDKYADWTRRHLLDEELEAALLPDIVHTGRKPIRRPDYW